MSAMFAYSCMPHGGDVAFTQPIVLSADMRSRRLRVDSEGGVRGKTLLEHHAIRHFSLGSHISLFRVCDSAHRVSCVRTDDAHSEW